MYQEKSKIIEKIQSYHKQVVCLFTEIRDKIDDQRIKSLIQNLIAHETEREQYLEKHKQVALAMNCYLDFPCEKLSNQIAECFKDLNTGIDISMNDLIKLEMHFDDCLIKLYHILSHEAGLSESMTNIFYYMLKKTKKEEEVLADMLFHSGSNMQFTHRA